MNDNASSYPTPLAPSASELEIELDRRPARPRRHNKKTPPADLTRRGPRRGVDLAEGRRDPPTVQRPGLLPWLLAARPQGDLRPYRSACSQMLMRYWLEISASLAAKCCMDAGKALRLSESPLPATWAMGSRVRGVFDGAEWIAIQHAAHFGSFGKALPDFYHVCEYLARAFPDPGEHRANKLRLLEGRCEETLRDLASREDPAGPAPASDALRYLSNRRGSLFYAEALAKGLPIGSGLIESGNRHVIQSRIKLAGAWWKPRNAEAMASIRVAKANRPMGKPVDRQGRRLDRNHFKRAHRSQGLSISRSPKQSRSICVRAMYIPDERKFPIPDSRGVDLAQWKHHCGHTRKGSYGESIDSPKLIFS